MKSELRAADSAKLRSARARGADPPPAHAWRDAQVGAVAAEALRTEVIGYTTALDILEPPHDGLGVPGDAADRDTEPVGAVRPGAEFPAMRSRLEHAESLAFEARPPARRNGGRRGQAVVLACHGIAVLVTAHAHVAGGDLRRAGQRGSDPARVRAALLDVEEQVCARAVRCEAKQLLDAEVLGRHADSTQCGRWTPGERELVHLSRRIPCRRGA